MICQTVFHYNFNQVCWNSPERRNEVLDPQFLLLFRAVSAELDGVIIFHHSGFSVLVTEKRRLEAVIRTENDFKTYRIGFPLELVDGNEHEFAVIFDGVRFLILCDGLEMDHEMPENPPLHIYDRDLRLEIHSPAVNSYCFANDLSGIVKNAREFRRNGNIQFYTPHGHNTWIGDVTVCQYKGRFHIFYLWDRHHHGTRNGNGAHEFWHISTDDFVNWTDHGPVIEVKALWQAIGTGNAFEFQEKLYLTYGLHTERAVPEHKHTKQLFMRNLARYGHSGLLHMSEVGTLLPHGASYVSSEDGLNFTCSNMLMHYLVNPVVTPQKDGTLLLCQQGLWTSDKLGDWKLIDDTFPPYGENSFARNCLDCPAFFLIDGWEYCMVGFTGFFGRKIGSDKWIDFTEKGYDTYDGINVPMTAHFKGKLIECGWLGGIGWGSCLVLREIIALGNGRLGKRWIPETLPVFEKAEPFSGTAVLDDSMDFLLEFSVSGDFHVRFDGCGNACELNIDKAMKRAQWSAAGQFCRTFREECLQCPEKTAFGQISSSPHHGRDYAKDNLLIPDDIFSVRILVHRDSKINAVILDAEIAGIHTMATMRNDLEVCTVTTENKINMIRKGK